MENTSIASPLFKDERYGFIRFLSIQIVIKPIAGPRILYCRGFEPTGEITILHRTARYTLHRVMLFIESLCLVPIDKLNHVYTGAKFCSTPILEEIMKINALNTLTETIINFKKKWVALFHLFESSLPQKTWAKVWKGITRKQEKIFIKGF